MSILTIIPARSGSKRLPGKNWEVVGGMTLVARAACQARGLTKRMVFVTDAPERCYGAGADVIKEPPELARDDVPMLDVAQWVLGELEAGSGFDAVMVLQPTSPLRTREDIQACLSIWERTRCDTVVTVTPDFGTKDFKRNGAIYISSSDFVSQRRLMEGWTQFYVMPPERSVDINTQEDLDLARKLWAEQHADEVVR